MSYNESSHKDLLDKILDRVFVNSYRTLDKADTRQENYTVSVLGPTQLTTKELNQLAKGESFRLGFVTGFVTERGTVAGDFGYPGATRESSDSEKVTLNAMFTYTVFSALFTLKMVINKQLYSDNGPIVNRI